MKPTVLLFNFTDKARVMKMKQAALPIGFRLRMIDKKDYHQKLGYLTGDKVFEQDAVEGRYEGEELPDAMLLMAGVTNSDIDKLLMAFRKKGVGFIPYKAMLTQTNSQWTPLMLFEEVKKEHEAMSK